MTELRTQCCRTTHLLLLPLASGAHPVLRGEVGVEGRRKERREKRTRPGCEEAQSGGPETMRMASVLSPQSYLLNAWPTL